MSPTIRQRSMIFSMYVPRGLRLNSTIPDETPRSQVAWNRSAAGLEPENLAFRIRETLAIYCSYTATADLN